jgi:surface antigen
MEQSMFKKFAVLTAAATLTLGLGTVSAFADDCSGHNHDTGTILGAAGGGIIGGVASHGNGLGIIGGALLGGLAGNAISRNMDCSDQRQAAGSYNDSFAGPPGVRREWHDPDGDHGFVITDREYRRGPRLCRDFTQVTYRRGREFDDHGTACRRRDGSWEFL